MKNEETARRLRKALADNNMKAQELADRAGIGKASISQYVNGTHIPGNISAAKMAHVLNVKPEWLMGFGSDPDEGRADELVRISERMNDEQLTRLISYAKFLLKEDEQ